MSTAPLETTSSLQPLTSYLVARSSPERFASLLRDLSPAAVSAGLTAFVFYTTSGVPLLLGITQRLGLDAAQTSSWFFIVFFSTAVTSLGLSLVYRQPLPMNWSLPGLLYLGGLAGHFSYPELVGANLMAGALILIVGVLRIGGQLVRLVPLPIAMGMFAGSIMGSLSALVTATVEDIVVGGATVAGYLLFRLTGIRSLSPVAIAALSGGIAIVIAQRATPVPVPWTPPVILTPEAHFSWSAAIAVSLPLMLLSIVLGNLQGLDFLLAQGYRVPVNVVSVVIGCQSLVNAMFGGHQAIVGRSGVAILASSEAGPLAGRYWSSLIANTLLIPVAFAAVPIAALLPSVPPAYLAALAGLAILPAFQQALSKALGGRLPLGATTAFFVSATPFAVGGITSALWALLAGLVVSLVAERRELLTPLKKEVEPIG